MATEKCTLIGFGYVRIAFKEINNQHDESFIFPIDYDKECSIENLSPTTINWILYSERNIKITINGKDIKDFNEFEKDFYDKVQEKEKVTIE